jgi:hypothetical protein
MYGIAELKPLVSHTGSVVECPVNGCLNRLPRPQRPFTRDERYFCASHQIFVSPSTFEYLTPEQNLLWAGAEDMALLNAIGTSKRESRMARDNSEDAVTWNVFRYLEHTGLLAGLLTTWIGSRVTDPQMIYWSYCRTEASAWSGLTCARAAFGEGIAHGSEPDLIVNTPQALIWIEAKVNAANRVPGRRDTQARYVTGGNGWFGQVFHTTYDEVAIIDERYELMRFWLLGSWLAHEMNCPFFLVSLVLERNEADLVSQFGKHVIVSTARQHQRRSWESIYEYSAAAKSSDTEAKTTLLRYFANKSLGYDGAGRLRRAFELPPSSRTTMGAAG